MTDYKLIYFNMQGRAEAIRILFHLADIPYEDVRVPHEDFAKLKPTLPYGQLPILKFGNEVLSQHCVIGRYLASKFGYHGQTDVESAQIDAIVDAVVDHQKAWWAGYSSRLDPKVKEEALRNYVTVATPRCLSRFNEMLAGSGNQFLVGQTLTWADISVFNHIKYFTELTGMDLTGAYPALKEFEQRMSQVPRIREYLQQRPKSSVIQEQIEYDEHHT